MSKILGWSDNYISQSFLKWYMEEGRYAVLCRELKVPNEKCMSKYPIPLRRRTFHNRRIPGKEDQNVNIPQETTQLCEEAETSDDFEKMIADDVVNLLRHIKSYILEEKE